MPDFRPRFITFDCYGTLTNFRMTAMAQERFAGRVDPEHLPVFLRDFTAYRRDEVLGDWKPYHAVIESALERTCRRWGLPYDPAEGRAFYEAIPTWGPHDDVPAPLARVAEHYPLVILSNAADDQIHSNVGKLGAPFHAVYTAEQAQAYKPRFRAFEYMLERLGCGPEAVLHVSSSLRYDLMTASDLRFGGKVYVNRGFEPSAPGYDYHEIADIGGLPGIVGL